MEKCKNVDNAQVQTKETRKDINPECALHLLTEGNQRFVNNSSLNRNLKRQTEETAGGQYPFAAVLSCMDSRTSSEIVFDQAIGDIFNIRIAGNFVTECCEKMSEPKLDQNVSGNASNISLNTMENTNVLGGLEFAVVMGVKVILVLGHTGCGAVQNAIIPANKKTCEIVEQDEKYAWSETDKTKPKFISPMIDLLRENVLEEGSQRPIQDLNKATWQNVEKTMNHIVNASPFISEAIKENKILLRGGVYDLSTRKVELLPVNS